MNGGGGGGGGTIRGGGGGGGGGGAIQPRNTAHQMVMSSTKVVYFVGDKLGGGNFGVVHNWCVCGRGRSARRRRREVLRLSQLTLRPTYVVEIVATRSIATLLSK